MIKFMSQAVCVTLGPLFIVYIPSVRHTSVLWVTQTLPENDSDPQSFTIGTTRPIPPNRRSCGDGVV